MRFIRVTPMFGPGGVRLPKNPHQDPSVEFSHHDDVMLNLDTVKEIQFGGDSNTGPMPYFICFDGSTYDLADIEDEDVWPFKSREAAMHYILKDPRALSWENGWRTVIGGKVMWEHSAYSEDDEGRHYTKIGRPYPHPLAEKLKRGK